MWNHRQTNQSSLFLIEDFRLVVLNPALTKQETYPGNNIKEVHTAYHWFTSHSVSTHSHNRHLLIIYAGPKKGCCNKSNRN